MKTLRLATMLFLGCFYSTSLVAQCPAICDTEPDFCTTTPTDCTYTFQDIGDGPLWYDSNGNLLGGNGQNAPQNVQSSEKVCILEDNSTFNAQNFAATLYVGPGATWSGNLQSIQGNTATFDIAGTFDPGSAAVPSEATFNICSGGLVDYPVPIFTRFDVNNYGGTFQTTGNLVFAANSSVINCPEGFVQTQGVGTTLTLDGSIDNCGQMISEGDININSSANVFNECTLWAQDNMRLDAAIDNDGIFIVQNTLTLNNSQIDNTGGNLKVGNLVSTSSPDSITGADGQVVVLGSTDLQNGGTFTDQKWCEGDPCQDVNAPGSNMDNQCSEVPLQTTCDLITTTTVIGINVPNAELSANCGDDLILTITPIELIFFNADAVNADSYLTWASASETNNSHFEIERSLDGQFFTYVATVESLSDDGFSDSQLNYSYTDKFAATQAAQVYYRVKQIDFDGTHAYTPTRLVQFSDVTIDDAISPNPVQSGDLVTIVSENVQTIDVFNSFGAKVYVQENTGNQFSTSISTTGFTNGIYYIVINGEKTLKLVVR